ncbi:MAG TPA: cytochrome C oxidase subunit IV family protein [Blastocatellia bacterium]|nr:cytochrome C oxidase subunit IV family protein [Blastocatellia bacterium]
MSSHSEHHVVPIKYYIGVFLALMVFTIITVVIASIDLEHYVNWGPANVVVALTVAVIKATLVVLYFMHVRWSSRLTQVIVIAGIFWLAIMLAFTLMDYLTRTGWPIPLGQ